MESGLLQEALKERILILDGAMGTMLQKMGGNSMENVEKVHRMYVEAGADIISTNTFVANEGQDIYNTNMQYCKLAKRVADSFADRKIFVAGSVGPSNKTLVMSEDCTFDELHKNYLEQLTALTDGGVDAFLFETVFDTLNLKAALTAAAELGRNIPLMISATVEKSGRLLSGQTLEAFVNSVMPFKPLSIGLNCSFGAREMFQYLKNLSEIAPVYVSAYPNAGLPNKFGEYDESPESMEDAMQRFFQEGLLNIAGGCCGTTPAHIEKIAALAKKYKPRKPALSESIITELSGLEKLSVTRFTHIGERTNVAGSKKFARLIAEQNYDEAMSVAAKQVEGGAQVIDVCMDAAMLDAKTAMGKFLHLAGCDPNIAKVPVMIDSSDWNVLVEGLKHVQGKSIVNSISLKEGEEVFLKKAEYIKRFGAAVVVMAFDEQGQADTLARRIEICSRAYNLLVTKAAFPPQDIIFDPNVLTIATGMKEHNHYAVDFIEAVRYIKENLPYAKTSGGISNLSFSFRGNNALREAMHSVFLYHAVKAGLDMAIVNPEMLEVYDNIPAELLQKVEDVVLDRYDGATEALIEYASTHKDEGKKKEDNQLKWRENNLQERLTYALVNGTTEFLQADVEEALSQYPALYIVETILMKGIGQVGEYFGEGKMFLPQVVKSAQVMKKAVSYLLPHIPEDSSGGKRPKVILATVKGDVHDIGKNIVGVVLSCNGFDVVDLGVMVPKETIVDEAIRNNASVICASGLITPSLNEMVSLARELQNRGLDLPLIVGGATTSDAHTAAFIDTEYSGAVVHATDASENVGIITKLLASDEFKNEIKNKYDALRRKMENAEKPEFKDRSVNIDWSKANIYKPSFTGVHSIEDYTVDDVIPYINWKAFCAAWKVKGDEAVKLVAEAKAFLQAHKAVFKPYAVVAIWPAHSEGDNIIVNEVSITAERRNGLSVADFVSPESDYVGAFAICVDCREFIDAKRINDDTFEQIMAQLLSDRLVEASSEYMFERMQKSLWGFKKGIRPAVGYPVLPNHALKATLFDMMGVEEKTPMRLTENYAIQPQSSVCGLYISNDFAKYF